MVWGFEMSEFAAFLYFTVSISINKREILGFGPLIEKNKTFNDSFSTISGFIMWENKLPVIW